ncbi:MAG TPA: Uma2 family endonuclease [Thermoanaerobaculia bacterium]|nr:Uma2 family endonuclease [Thermoanaerobaculia bacterium]
MRRLYVMATETSIRLDYEDYAAIPNDGRRHEIIDGAHYENPAPTGYHQIILSNVEFALQLHVRTHHAGRVLPSPVDVILSGHDIVQPDIIFLRSGRTHLLQKNLKGAPDLVVEVLSEGNRRHDVRTKYGLYERAGVPEYWIIDPDELAIRVFRLDGDKFALVDVGDTITTPLLPGFALPLSDIFAM